ncbi:MAG TPA: SDR family oxidoreductase [Gemmatales bacterium]|nr:SDR family oxidoreductase [Gemmatales bacterium]
MSTASRLRARVAGASSGRGVEFARLLAAEGHDLVLVARSSDKLASIAQDLQGRHGGAVHPIPVDLAVPHAPDSLVNLLRERGLSPDLLINNAGFGSYGPFIETDLGEQLRMIQVNVAALTHLTHLLLPEMMQRRCGRILNVASTAAFQPGPLMAVYYATKAFVLSFSEALANELNGSGVTVTCLCPGPTQTGFQERAAMTRSRLVAGRKIMDATAVARAGLKAMHKGKTLVIPGLGNKLLTLSVRLAPRQMVTKMVRGLQSPRGE